MAASIGNIVTVDNTTDGVASTSVTIPTPNHNAGDILIYIIVRNGSDVSSAPSDVDLAVGGNTATSPTDWWYMRSGSGTGSEPASRSWTFNPARVTAAACVVVQGALYPTGLQSKQTTAYGNTPSISTLSSNTTNAFALALCITSMSAFPLDSRTDTAVTQVLSGGSSLSCGFDLQSAQLPTVGTTKSMGWDLAGSGNFNIAMTSVVLQSAGSDTRPVITTSASARIVAPGSTVTLVATASDPDVGDSIVSYSWVCPDATADVGLITIGSPTSATTTVTIPNYEAAFTFVCTVTDTSGISTSNAIGICGLNTVPHAPSKLFIKNLNGSLTQLS